MPWLLMLAVWLGGVGPSDASPAVDLDSATVRLVLADEPPNLDSVLATDQISSFVLQHVNEGLMRYGRDGRLEGAIAQRWEITADKARFWLKQDARWEDGQPVSADDFVYAWRRLVDPASAAQYAPLLFPVANAAAINRGELPVSALAVHARSPHELEIVFETPCPWFLGLTAYTSLLPQRADVVARFGRAYAADAEKMLSNGAFRLTEWVHGASLVMERNPMFREAGTVRLARIEVPHIVADSGAQLNLFFDNRIALAKLSSDQVRETLKRRHHVRRFVDGGTMFLRLNQREDRLTANRWVRKALQAAIEPDELVNKVLRQPGLVPTDSMFPSMFRIGEERFTERHPTPPIERGDAAAKQFMALAEAEMGEAIKQPLYMVVAESAVATRFAEYLQQRLARLGMTLRIDKQTFKIALQKGREGDFDLILSGWFPDYDDPMTFADLLASWNPNNRGRYRNVHYDQLIEAATHEIDPARRFALFAQMQAILVEDAPVIPLFETAQLYVQHPALRGVLRTPYAGDPVLRYAWVEAP